MIGWFVFCICFWFLLKIIETIKSKLQNRRYKLENDPGRKGKAAEQGGDKPTGIREPNNGKQDIQDVIKYAKQELLPSGDGGVDNDDTSNNN